MEKSDLYYQRKRYMDALEVPPMSEIRKFMGPSLSEAFFSTCPDALKPNVGLTPPLHGTGPDLWISPSDVLLGKVVLKPPLTNKHMKALTHQGIMMIGSGLETKLINQFELEKQKALAELEEMLEFMAEMRKRKAVDDARQEERERCAAEKEAEREEFRKFLESELRRLEDQLRTEYDKLMREKLRLLEIEWEEKLEDAVDATIEKMKAELADALLEQEQKLLKKHELNLKKVEYKNKLEIKVIKERGQEVFLQLKHQMQCKNIANIMYILCMERRKCQFERDHLEDCYRKDLKELQDTLIDRDVEIRRLKRELENSKRRMDLREECVLEILRQFQKFINYTLKASPKQAEFLLSAEKMMIFELTDAICKSDKIHGEQLARKLLRWKSEVRVPEQTTPSSQESLIANDHHSCFDEVETPRSKSTASSNEYLPAFHFDKHLYVKEDFRNMMSQGIKTTSSNLQMWNKDVESLQNELCRSQTSLKEQIEAEKELKDGQLNVLYESDEKPEEIKVKQFKRSSIYFNDQEGKGGFLYPSFNTISDIEDLERPPDTPSDSVIVMGPCCKPCIVPQSPSQDRIVVFPESLERLVRTEGAHDSATYNCFPDEKRTSPTLLLGTQDSLIMHRMSLKPTLYIDDTASGSADSVRLIPIAPDKLKSKKLAAKRESLQSSQKQTDYNTGPLFDPSKRHNRKSIKQTFMLDTPTTLEISNESVKLSDDKIKSTESLKTPRTSKERVSKLSSSRDSLILLRSQSLLSKKKRDSSAEIGQSVELHTTIPEEIDPVFDVGDVISLSVPDLIYKVESEQKVNYKKDNFMTKPNVANLAGDESATEHLQDEKEFAMHRIDSLLTIFKKHPSLMKIFSPCSK